MWVELQLGCQALLAAQGQIGNLRSGGRTLEWVLKEVWSQGWRRVFCPVSKWRNKWFKSGGLPLTRCQDSALGLSPLEERMELMRQESLARNHFVIAKGLPGQVICPWEPDAEGSCLPVSDASNTRDGALRTRDIMNFGVPGLPASLILKVVSEENQLCLLKCRHPLNVNLCCHCPRICTWTSSPASPTPTCGSLCSSSWEGWKPGVPLRSSPRPAFLSLQEEKGSLS